MLQDRVTRVEEERDSLRLALKFLMLDQSVNNATPSAVDSGNCWKTVKRAKSRTEYQSNPSLNNKPGNKSELNTTESTANNSKLVLRKKKLVSRKYFLKIRKIIPSRLQDYYLGQFS